ncbi:MAG: RNA polymerase factor sigma-54 [Acidobacteria bacterium]|nr:RNA polymerase factor sigma-54 [Acidobacteriota bacterium]
MALEQKLRLKLSQRLVMTPSLQQAIKLLQLSRLELGETLSQEILENPILEVEEEAESPQADLSPPPGSGATQEASPAERDSALPTEEESYGEIDVEAFFADYLGDLRSEGPSMAYGEERENRLENTISASPGLYDHLLWQLHLTDAPAELLTAGEFIIGNLDEDGYLQVDDAEIEAATGLQPAQVASALEIVRSLDPPGIGARSLQECLLIQLEVLRSDNAIDAEEVELLERSEAVISSYWDDLLHQRWVVVAAHLGCEVEELRLVLDVLQRLEPKPGRKYHQSDNAYIEPDVYVKRVEGEYQIILNDDGMPKLRMNSEYLRMLETKVLGSEVQGYLRDKMRSALWLIKSIDQRQRTIYKVAQSIVSYQRDFLDHGIEALRPMVLRQVADDIGMHESTVSRVVSNKYMHTPRGLYPMRFFFHSGVDSVRGENVSSLVVKEHIRKLIEAEDPGRPLSDSKIMKMLQREGTRLARRTVAKYREEMGIPSSEKRKRVF